MISITSEDIEEKEVVNEEKHSWTRRHFWALHFATLVIAMGASGFLIYWINWDSGISIDIECQKLVQQSFFQNP